ncbi:hypothetical protein ROLI_025120 [Roseobacter fucihabitans]|uniref:LysM domain-containing protein n=1 Tax=Roseobacter fucihabitans TaxID=1537242 RepID=A0ABZ2BVJ4_9RHOB|nr:LysM peptidoglycan-binding domain-containing protein [Roseobacter litoralis]MBC6965184.1 LysM domain/BON superfamily protein [Roseobacter litoralis]
MRENQSIPKSGSSGLLMAGVIIAGLAAVGVYIGVGSDGTLMPQELNAIEAPQAVAPGEGQIAAIPQVSPEPATNDEQPGATEGATGSPAILPRIEEVRLESDGLTVIAGRAAPDADVSVLVDGVVVATARADTRGAFAAVAFVAPGAAARVLTLEAETGGETVASAADVILAPQRASGDTPAATEAADRSTIASAAKGQQELAEATAQTDTASPPAPGPLSPTGALGGDDVLALSSDVTAPAPQPGTDVAQISADTAPDAGGLVGTIEDSAAASDAVAAPAPDVAPQPEPSTIASSQPGASEAAPGTIARAPSQDPEQKDGEETGLAQAAAPWPGADIGAVAVLKSDADGVGLLQPDAAPALSIDIDTIGYSDLGDVELSGRAVPGSLEARVYLDNRFVSSLAVDAQGAWRGTVPDLDEGTYTLRVDEVNAAGDVTSRLETPFRREAPEALAEASAAQEGPVRAITVQTGDTLWAIARERYGEGLFFLRVFEANAGSIRDPDLIYPGQVFDLPSE